MLSAQSCSKWGWLCLEFATVMENVRKSHLGSIGLQGRKSHGDQLNYDTMWKDWSPDGVVKPQLY